MPSSQQAAAKTIQQCFRNGKLRKDGKARLSLWPTVNNLRSLYLDTQAQQAGAEGSEFYTDEMIVAREALRKNIQVEAAVLDAWDNICVASGSGDEIMTYTTYEAMSRKLYLLFQSWEMEGYIDASEVSASVEADWADDAGGKTHM